MKYKTVTVEPYGVKQDHIVIEREDGSFETFPADAENPRYQAFLAELEPAK